MDTLIDSLIYLSTAQAAENIFIKLYFFLRHLKYFKTETNPTEKAIYYWNSAVTQILNGIAWHGKMFLNQDGFTSKNNISLKPGNKINRIQINSFVIVQQWISKTDKKNIKHNSLSGRRREYTASN